jgi:nucleoid-associated protein YgaU
MPSPAQVDAPADPVSSVATTPLKSETPSASALNTQTPAPPPAKETTPTLEPAPASPTIEVSERSFKPKADVEPSIESAPPAVQPEMTAVPANTEPPAVTTEKQTVTPPPALPDLATLSEKAKPTTVVMTTPAVASQPAEVGAKPIVHVMATGETYSSLAEKYLGGTKYANLIVKANPGKDPRKIQVGAKVIIPPAPKTPAPVSTVVASGSPSPTSPIKPVRATTEKAPPVSPERAYTVQAGETWHGLARRYLGDGNRWVELFELNKERAPNPNHLQPGTVIELPAGVKASSRPS